MKQSFINQLDLYNYRCFRELKLTLDERLTVFVAPNGGGKTAVLDAIATALRLFVDTVAGRTNQGFTERDIRLVLAPDSKMEPVTPVRLQASGRILGNNITWARQRESTTSRTGTVEASELKQIATRLAKKNQEWVQSTTGEAPPLFPLVSYYGTGRLWSTSKLMETKRTRETAPNARHRGYTDCLSPSSHYKYFLDWFRRFSYEAKKDVSLHQPRRTLEAVQKAVDTALLPSGWHGLEWDFAEDAIIAHHSIYGRLPVDMLSDGIRNMIGLVADIAHRTARLNPQLREKAALETPGIILIDEVDMHLHPQWQQVVLQSLQKAFPLMQFIVTTHSPQVLTTLRRQNIRVLSSDAGGNWAAREPTMSPLAHESGDALALIMETDPRPQIPDVIADLHAYEQLAREGKGKSIEAIAIQTRLGDAGFEFNPAERSLFDFLAQQAEEASKH